METGSSIMTEGNPVSVTPAVDATSAPQPAANTGNWYDSWENQELKGYVQNKGWKDPSELAVGYQNLEKLLGGEKLPMPKGADDLEGWNRVFDSLGRPTAATDYKMGLPEGADPTFAKAASEKFYELGLSSKQAEALASWYNEQASSAQQSSMDNLAQQADQQLSDLRREWGGAYDENVELGRRAAREFGLGQDKLNALEMAFGTGDMMKFMAQIGRGMTEHNFEGGRSPGSFGMTPAAAQSRIAELRNDKQWASSYLNGNADARAEMARLMSLAYPSE